jgi:hypothetical protein
MNYLAPVNGFIGKHSLAPHVLHKGQSVVQQFHDCGYLIQHVSPVADHITGTLQSSRVVIFGAGLVKIEGTAVGFAIFKGPSTPMLTCGTYPMPVGGSHDSTLNSVVVGMDPEWDHQCGWDHVGLLIFKSFVGQVIEGVIMLVTLGLEGPAESAQEFASGAATDMAKGLGIQLLKQVAGDSIGSSDIGRRYQERMQRRRGAGESFDSAREGELARGAQEGVGEAVYGPVGDVLGGPLSDWAFGTGPQEPEL